MATDYQQMLRNLEDFYSFRDKEILAAGAGGGRFIEIARDAKRLIAIDPDAAALEQLRARVVTEGTEDRVTIVQAAFCETSFHGDVAYFEFSLHEMEDPERALRHAFTLAPEVVIFDRLPDSEWVFYAVEEDKVRRSTSIVERFPCLRHRAVRTEQRFRDHAELVEKVACQGPVAVERAERFREVTDIVIPMTYGLTLLSRGAGKF